MLVFVNTFVNTSFVVVKGRGTWVTLGMFSGITVITETLKTETVNWVTVNWETVKRETGKKGNGKKGNR